MRLCSEFDRAVRAVRAVYIEARAPDGETLTMDSPFFEAFTFCLDAESLASKMLVRISGKCDRRQTSRAGFSYRVSGHQVRQQFQSRCNFEFVRFPRNNFGNTLLPLF